MFRTILKGALVGAAATWAMQQVTTFLYERESEDALEREEEARGGETAYVTAARKAAELVGASVDEEEQARLGSAIHWALGIGAGIAFAALRPALPWTGIGRGLVYGSAFFALMDELAVPALGLTPGPAAFPWQTHARGLAGHLAYGLAAEAVLQAIGDRGRRRGEPLVRVRGRPMVRVAADGRAVTAAA